MITNQGNLVANVCDHIDNYIIFFINTNIYICLLINSNLFANLIFFEVEYF